MEAVLYSVLYEAKREWRVSLDPALRTDLAYWLRRDPSVRIWRSADALPFGRALAEANRLEETGAGTEQCPIPLQEVVSFGEYQGYSAGDDALADKLADAMKGRSLLPEEFVSLLDHMEGKALAANWMSVAQQAYLTGMLEYHPGIRISSKRTWFGLRPEQSAECRRCGSRGSAIRWTDCASCGELCPYCETCLTMGRARACSPLLIGRGRSKRRQEQADGQADDMWMEDTIPYVPLGDLRLSPAQAAAAEAGLRFLTADSDEHGRTGRPLRRFLIWAVTGAGKTEMMYPLIASERSRGGRVLIATPRKDVVLELLPRVQATFAGHSVAALYGGSVQRWESADITVATTHQLLRYEAAFDLVVLDEVDAFPYHNNPMLEYAAHKACKPGGAFVFLSATPPVELQRAARSGKLPHVKVPVRFHRHPLPVPVQTKPNRLIALLRESLERDAQVFLFVPQIGRLEPELRRVRQALAALCEPGRIDATSSQDPDRQEKVLRFRSGEIRILLTTTILERGVTIPKSDVLILDADSRLFDAAALVQMAGRAGRSAKDPYGRVYFLARQRTRAQAAAVRQIKSMNRLAKHKGYLL